MSSPLATDSLADQAMEERSNANAIRMPRVWPRGGLSLRLQPLSLDWLSIALVLLLAITWLSEGGAALAGVSPRWAGRVVQLGETAIVIWLALRLARERRFRLLLPVAVYAAWVASGLINSHSPLGEQTTALRYWLLVPALGALLAFEGSSERRARAVIVTLFALAAFEFLVTVVQLIVVPYAGHDADLIVGSFGTFDGGVLGVVVVLLACVAFGGYLINARRGRQALAASMILALVSCWAVVKLATILLPVVFVITALTALLLKQTDRRRALIGIGAALLSSAAVVGSYAVFKPASLTALSPGGGLGSYVTYGSIAGGLTRAQVGDMVVGDYWNALVTSQQLPVATRVPRARGFRIFDIRGGAYTTGVSKPGTVSWPVQPGRPYSFSVEVIDGAHLGQIVVPEIEWLSPRLHPLTDSVGRAVGVTDHQGSLITAAGFAPPGASFAIPKIAVFGKVPAGASIYAWSPEVKLTTPQVVAGSHEASLGQTTVSAYWNVGVEPRVVPPLSPGAPARTGFRIANLRPGNYTAFISRQHHAPLAVVPGRVYTFTVTVGDLTAGQAYIQPQIEWRTVLSTRRAPFRGIVATTYGSFRAIPPIAGGGTRLRVSGVAPPRARFAFPKLAITGQPPAGSATFAYQPVLQGIRRGASGSTIGRTSRPGARRVAPPASHPASPPHRVGSPSMRHPHPARTTQSAGNAGTPAPVVGVLPGHLSLLKSAVRGLSGSMGHELFGFGLGSASSSRLGHTLDAAHLTPQAAGSYSDLGTLVIERGWTGVALVALLAVGFVLLAFRLTARSVGVGGWATAFRLAVPGAIVALSVYALIGDYLRTYSSAITFWIIIGLGLATRSKPTPPRERP